MSDKSRNDGVRIIADFRDRAIPLPKGQTNQGSPEKTSRSLSTGTHPIADFREGAQPSDGNAIDGSTEPAEEEIAD